MLAASQILLASMGHRWGYRLGRTSTKLDGVTGYRLWHGSPVAASYGRGRVAASLRLIAICDGYRATDYGAKEGVVLGSIPGRANATLYWTHRSCRVPRVLARRPSTVDRPRPEAAGRSGGALEQRCLYPDGPLLFALPAGKLADHPE
jgi:hypothetical protein